VDSVLLQDWVTLSLGSSVSPNTITQGADKWLDLTTVTDAVFYLDVKQPGSGSNAIAYQTAPRREDASFVTMVTMPIALTTTTQTTPVIAAYASVPVARYVRWQVSFAGSLLSVTFRIWLATYSAG
jgi:hypothetical protein